MKFVVYKDGKVDKDFVLCGAYKFGPDRIPLRNSGQIKHKKGLIEIQCKPAETCGLALLWDVPGFGKVILHTTRLPERQRAYVLNVELARAKLMEVTTRREAWSLFDQTNSIGQQATEAGDIFVEALQNIDSPAAAAQIADKALAKSLFFSEHLTEKYADILFEARRNGKGFNRANLGCRISPEQVADPKYLKGVQDVFANITIPVNWRQIETAKGEYDFSQIDKCIDAFGKKKMVICAGPIIRFSEDYLPDWLLKSKPDFEQIREACCDFISTIINRYSRYINMWIVLGGVNCFNHFQFGFERMLEITRVLMLSAKEVEKRTIKTIGISSVWGEYFADMQNTIPPLVYVDMVTQAGINFDALGIEMMFGKNAPDFRARDMMQISSLLDYFAAVPKPLHITAAAVPDGLEEQKQAELAGFWHAGWDRKLQAEWIEFFYRIALSKPFVNTITYANLIDGQDNVVKSSGLLTAAAEPKPAYIAIAKIQKSILKKPKI